MGEQTTLVKPGFPTRKGQTGKIWFDFSPLPGDDFAVEKADEGGEKHRYLVGITSGQEHDGHGERMTEKAINSFQRQAKSGEIPLYVGKHDVNFIDDIGRLVDSSILPNGDWTTTYRLYDASDGLGPQTLEHADKAWRQIKGLPPYNHPQPRGFSIEGDIPEGGIAEMDSMGRRVMDDVDLAGTVLVRKPAYRTSVAHAVYKALGLLTKNEIRRSLLGDTVQQKAEQQQQQRDYYDQVYALDDALRELVRSIMISDAPDKSAQLTDIYQEYSELMIELTLNNPDVFGDSGYLVEGPPSAIYEATDGKKQELLNRLSEAQDQLYDLVQRMKTGGEKS